MASGYDGARFGPNDPVSHAQAIALIARAMVAAGRWAWQPDGPAPPMGTPPAHDLDLRTFLHYAGNPPALLPARGWDDGAARGWLAQALQQALQTAP